MRNKLRKILQERVYTLTYALELIVAIFIIIAILMSIVKSAQELPVLWATTDTTAFRSYLEVIFDIVIGIEFIKMLCRHDLSSVIEVLLFAIARQMVVEHMSTKEGLFGIVSIGVLFAVRKYLYIEKDNKHII